MSLKRKKMMKFIMINLLQGFPHEHNVLVGLVVEETVKEDLFEVLLAFVRAPVVLKQRLFVFL